MEARTGSITVAALLGTGLATIGFALSGVSALGDDLHAARVSAPAVTAPLLTPGEESSEATPAQGIDVTATRAAREQLRLQEACDRKHGRRGDAGPTTPAEGTTPTPPSGPAEPDPRAGAAPAKEY